MLYSIIGIIIYCIASLCLHTQINMYTCIHVQVYSRITKTNKIYNPTNNTHTQYKEVVWIDVCVLTNYKRIIIIS